MPYRPTSHRSILCKVSEDIASNEVRGKLRSLSRHRRLTPSHRGTSANIRIIMPYISRTGT